MGPWPLSPLDLFKPLTGAGGKRIKKKSPYVVNHLILCCFIVIVHRAVTTILFQNIYD